ncbi:INO80 complex subunit D-like [Clytia hemisphaerica]
MFEGKNIHLSPIDGKPLCSFSKKLCRQRRLHNYAFCIRHILEDTDSPFKQCPYQTKSGDICINAVPVAAAREYCNKHMLMMGLQPKTTKTQIDKKPVTTTVKKACSKAIKSKISTNSSKKVMHLMETLQKEDATKSTHARKRQKSYDRYLSMSVMRRHIWSKQPRSDVMKELIENKKYFRKTKKKKTLTSYTLGTSEDESDSFIESFQQQFDNDGSHNSSAEKLLTQLKHQHVQLQNIVKEKMKSTSLSYSVLSTLVEASRENVTETANILTDGNSKNKVYHQKEESITTKIPCCMVTGSTRCSQMALPFSRYCRNHINEDTDQLLFVPKNIASLQRSDVPGLKIFRPDLLPKGLKASSSLKAKRKVCRKSNWKRKGAQKKTPKKPTKPKTTAIQASSQSSQETTSEIDLSDVQHPDNLSIGTPPILSESSSSYTESDSESDILTPEEAFRLPPGSLSYPPGLDDEDSLTGMHHTARACNIADEEDELMRCGSNFSMDNEKQDMITRELSSPTLNQFSEFDQSLFGAATAFSPTSGSDVTLPHTSSLTSPNQEITPLSASFGTNPKYSSKNPSPLKNHTNSHTGHGSVTTLKITPLNMSPRKASSKLNVRPPLLTSQSMVKPPLVSNTFTQSSSTKDESWNKQYMQIDNFGDPDLLNDIAMDDEETPLEKVNPDIFFSSAFPVTTTASND